MEVGIVIFAILAWVIGLVSLFHPILVAKAFFLAPKKFYDHFPLSIDRVARDFLDILYSDPDSLESKFPGVNSNTRLGGLISLIVAIALTYKLFH
jgi:hypothetical protein